MIDRALDFMVPFFAVLTVLCGMGIAAAWLWSMLPVFIAWFQSSYMVGAFFICAAGFAFSLAISIARH